MTEQIDQNDIVAGSRKLRLYWLSFLGFYFIHFFTSGLTFFSGIASLMLLAGFLHFYLRAFDCVGTQVVRPLIGILIIAAVASPINWGASVMFTYAAFFAGFNFSGDERRKWFATILVLITAMTWLFSLPIYNYFLPAVITSTGLFFIGKLEREALHARQAQQRSNDEIERLATINERERIARDLHDLLGHTLSSIALKAELTHALIGKDNDRAQREAKDVTDIARDALHQVREVVSGYRHQSLREEATQLQRWLALQNIEFEWKLPEKTPQQEQEQVLCWILREGITNIARHSNANRATFILRNLGDVWQATLRDNGRTGSIVEGNGMAGIRERVASLNGEVNWNTDDGTQLRVQWPSNIGETTI